MGSLAMESNTRSRESTYRRVEHWSQASSFLFKCEWGILMAFAAGITFERKHGPKVGRAQLPPTSGAVTKNYIAQDCFGCAFGLSKCLGRSHYILDTAIAGSTTQIAVLQSIVKVVIFCNRLQIVQSDAIALPSARFKMQVPTLRMAQE
jgi:hypothetical protein